MSDLQIMSKFTVGGHELSNRLVLAPLTRARGTPTEDPLDPANTMLNETQVEYYVQRATAGLIITEATSISEEGHGWLNAPSIRSKEHAASWKKVTDAVHAKGGFIFLQLWHMGRQAHSGFHPTTKRTVSASNIPCEKTNNEKGENVAGEVPHALTIPEIKSTVQDYVNATRNAKEAGFDGVEIHSANGYLPDQFLQSVSNKRTDQYGGSMENRFRFLKEITEAIIADGAFPANRIGFRLSPNGNFGSMGSEDNVEMFTYVAQQMNKYGLAYCHVMDGLGFGFHQKSRIFTCTDIRKVFDGPIIANIGLTKEVAEGMVRSGAVDLTAFGRLYISNPDLPERFANNWPTNDLPPYETWWKATGAKGYTDWPTYEETKKKEESSGLQLSETGNVQVQVQMVLAAAAAAVAVFLSPFIQRKK